MKLKLFALDLRGWQIDRLVWGFNGLLQILVFVYCNPSVSTLHESFLSGENRITFVSHVKPKKKESEASHTPLGIQKRCREIGFD